MAGKARFSKILEGKESTDRLRHTLHTATPSMVRDVNRSIVLNLIRIHQPISRARLSELTGIFRSNISDIVKDLLDRRLLIEKRAEPISRGRVPFHLYLNQNGFHVVAASIRASETTVALAGLTGGFLDRIAFPTPERPAAVVDRIALEVRRLRLHFRLSPASARVGVSVPGLVDGESGLIRWSPALPQYSNFDIAEALEHRTGLPTTAENDSNLAALAELSFAEAEANHLRDFVFLEIGDVGVGGGIVINRALYRGHDHALSAEFGHMVVESGSPKCSCGRFGCWELFVCNQATLRRYSPHLDYSAESFDRFLESLDSGEAASVAAIGETARYLSVGVSNIAFALNPQVIIVAGRLTQAWRFIEPVILQQLDSTKLRVTVQTARYNSEELFLHGAVRLALNRLFAHRAVGW